MNLKQHNFVILNKPYDGTFGYGQVVETISDSVVLRLSTRQMGEGEVKETPIDFLANEIWAVLERYPCVPEMRMGGRWQKPFLDIQ